MPANGASGFTPRLLVVDDTPENVQLLERLLARWGYTDVVSTTDSSRALPLVDEAEPDLLLLDLQMPAPDGYEIMGTLAARDTDRVRMPILVLTADVTPEARRRALDIGASDFVSKPFDFDEVRLRVRNLLETRRLQMEIAGQNEVLERRVRARTRDLERTRLEILRRLALAAEYRDDDTHEHAERVGRTAAMLADTLGLEDDVVATIRHAAPLHDVGKIAIRDAILLKPAALTPVEYEQMKAHTVIGGRMLGDGGSRVLDAAEQIALTHHERWDGRGYPRGLAGDAIPVAGRVTAVADVFDALTHERPYKEAYPVDVAVEEIRSLAGAAFDPEVVRAFEELDHRSLVSAAARSTSTEAGFRPIGEDAAA